MFEIAVELQKIFAGNNSAYGEFIITGEKGAKKTGKVRTVRGEPNVDKWIEHLEGKAGLGIVPINEHNQCKWGCVDIDQYDGLDLEALSKQLPEPLVLCRTKSGGAHIFIFMNTPTTASLMRKKLTLVARAVGFPNSEIFPKQDSLNEGEIGNWLNMPYFDKDSTLRFCIKNGIELNAEEFIDYVNNTSISTQELVAFVPDSLVDEAEDIEFVDAPPCLRYLVNNGFPTGSRNNALFSMGVFARKKFANGWEQKVFEYNERFMGPGTYTEVAGIIKSLNRKVYTYKCKDQPLMAYCDRDTCASCTYGMPYSDAEEVRSRPNILDQVTKVIHYPQPVGSQDEPSWKFTIDDKELLVNLDMLFDQAKFCREYARQFSQIILSIKAKTWATTMNALLNSAEVAERAPDAGPEGQMWLHLADFCTNKARARAKEEIVLGKPWTEDGRTYFRASDFIKYLDQQRFRAFKERDLWNILQLNGAEFHRIDCHGRKVTCWSIPAFEEQTEGFATPGFNDDYEF